MPMSLALSTAIAELIVNNTPIPAYGPNRYLALHHANPTNACTVQELTGDNYSRVLIPLSIIQLANGKGVANSDVLVFPVASGTKVSQILYGSVWDALNAGNPISYGALTAPANWVSGSSLSLAINAFIQLIRNTI